MAEYTWVDSDELNYKDKTANNPPSNNSDLSGGSSGGYGYGYGYGGGGMGASPTDQQKKVAANLAPITKWSMDTTLGKQNNMEDVYNVADEGNTNIYNTQIKNARKAAGQEWFSRLLKEQSAYEHHRDQMGQSRYGTNALQLNTSYNRVHDANAVQVLEALENNIGDLDTDYYTALQQNVNARNELAANTEAALRASAGDYAAQLNNIHPDLAEGVIDTENNSINLPDWMTLHGTNTETGETTDTSLNQFYATNRQDARHNPVVVPMVDDIRPPQATQEQQWYEALRNGNKAVALAKNNKSNNRMAANKRYWDMLTNDYNHRRV